MFNTENKIIAWLPLGLSLILFAVFSHFFFWQIGDDSYIYFRYVERALHGKWWSWTDQLSPVEGYSSSAWYFLLIAIAKLGVSVEIAARTLGLIFSFFTVLGTWLLARTLKATVFMSGCACLLLVLNQGFNYWSTAGLETSFYMLIYVSAAIGIIRERFWLLPVALIGVARPEGPILLVAILVCMFIVKRNRISVYWLLAALLPTLLWIALRISIYNVPLPNTYYAKATGDFANQLFSGTIYSFPIMLLLITSWLLLFKTKNKQQMIVLGMVTLLWGIIWLGGGDFMHHFRLLTPLWGLLLAVVVSQFSTIAIWQRVVVGIALIPMLLLIVHPTLMLSAFKGEQFSHLGYQEGEMTHQSIVMAAEISKRYLAGKLIAVNHAGALPWALQDYRFIDMIGLNDVHIANLKGRLHKKYDAAYVLNQKPDLIVLNSRVKPGTDGVWYHKGYWDGETAIVENPLFENYRATDMAYKWEWKMAYPYSLFVPNKITSWIMLYERKD